MTRFNKHLGLGEDLDIDGEKYRLKPLGTEGIPAYIKLMRAFTIDMNDAKNTNKSEAELAQEVFGRMNDDTLASVKYLIDRTMEVSFPEDWKENRQELQQFGMKYMMILLPKILEINSASQGQKGTMQGSTILNNVERLKQA